MNKNIRLYAKTSKGFFSLFLNDKILDYQQELFLLESSGCMIQGIVIQSAKSSEESPITIFIIDEESTYI